MSKGKIKIQIMKKEICRTCIRTATFRKCPDCRKPKCIMCFCKCQAIKDLPIKKKKLGIKNKKPVTKAIRKPKKRQIKN